MTKPDADAIRKYDAHALENGYVFIFQAQPDDMIVGSDTGHARYYRKQHGEDIRPIPIATQLFVILKLKGVTIAEAARRAGVNPVSLRNQIAGRKAMSEKQSLKILAALAKPPPRTGGGRRG